MRSTLGVTILLAVAIATASVSLPRRASGDPCSGGCVQGKAVCHRQARTSLNACKARCASGASRKACRHACRKAGAAARSACGTSLADCQDSCPPSPVPPGTCVAGCGTDARTCFGKVGAGGKSCILGCNAGDPNDRADCFEHCAAALQTGAAHCLAVFGTCVGSCAGGVSGNCLDTIARECTDQACSPSQPCAMPNEFCTARCAPPPSSGTCFDTRTRQCTDQTCTIDQTCPSNELCVLHCPPPLPTGTCFNRRTQQCGAACSPVQPCSAAGAFIEPETEICIPQCPPPLPSGTCLDPTTAQCGGSCAPTAPCPQDQLCVPACPLPPPTGKCFSTVARQCTQESCSPRQPCTQRDEFCTLQCPPLPEGQCLAMTTGQCTTQSCSPTAPCPLEQVCVIQCPSLSSTTTTSTTLPGSPCRTDVDCDDGDGCTHDACLNGTCVHVCLCLTADGASACCPGPAALCVRRCGTDVEGVCGGLCPLGATCETVADGTTCGCVSGLGGPCGGNLFAPPPVCAPGLVCQQASPDVTGVCVAATVTTTTTVPGALTWFYTCGDPVCGRYTAPSGVPPCSPGEVVGASCSAAGTTCDPGDTCNRLLVCTTSDPTHGGICPI
jgi:hypothetical protein